MPLARQIASRSLLERSQAECRQDREEVVEDLRLEGLVVQPHRVVREAVDLDRRAVGAGGELTDHEDHVLVGQRVSLEVSFHIRPEDLQVREGRRQGDALVFADFRSGVASHLVELLPHVGTQQFAPGKRKDLFVREEPHGVHVNENGALDSPSSRLGHAAPVLEGFADEPLSRDRLVPVLHPDRVQVDVALRIKSNTEARIHIMGHADAVQIGDNLLNKYPSNWKLSVERSMITAQYLLDKTDLNMSQFIINGSLL